MKKKTSRTVWVGFITVSIIYLFIVCNILGILGGWVRNGYVATLVHLDENTSATIYILIRDLVFLFLLICIIRGKV